MPSFLNHATIYEAPHLAAAFEEACRRLAVDPAPSGSDDQGRVRDQLARAIVNAAKLGVSDPMVLSNVAVAFGAANGRLAR